MDPNELTKAAVAVVLPWLLETGSQALEKVQGQAVEGAAAAPARIYSWLREKLAPTSKVATAVLEELPANPKDETNQKMLELQLAKLLESNEALRAELAALVLPAAQGAQTMAQTANQTGSGNKLAQVAGQGNTTNIS